VIDVIEAEVKKFALSQNVEAHVMEDPRGRGYVLNMMHKRLTVGKRKFEQTYEYTKHHNYTHPVSGWDYIKSLLPHDLQFGWLKPQYKTRRIPWLKQVTYTGEVEVFYPAPDGYDYLVRIPYIEFPHEEAMCDRHRDERFYY